MMKAFWIRFWKETEGQDLVEYALIVAAIALAMIATVREIGNALSSLYLSISTALASIT
jgi:Flp pilus assembly pilin Flp